MHALTGNNAGNHAAHNGGHAAGHVGSRSGKIPTGGLAARGKGKK
jgi:hypothetical protein